MTCLLQPGPQWPPRDRWGGFGRGWLFHAQYIDRACTGALVPEPRRSDRCTTTGDAMLERLAIDTVRVLAMDAVQQAGSGHPGTAMALAPAAYVLWTKFLSYDP